jgi:two-component system cell cycle sensor histidine kinase/response regulator CckA
MEVFFNFTFDNWLGVSLALIPALMNFAIFLYILFYLPKNGVCYTFSLFVASLAIWQASDVFARISTTSQTALLWYELLAIGPLLITPAGLHFTFLFTENINPSGKRLIHSPLALFLLYYPVILFFSLSHITVNTSPWIYLPVWGWQTDLSSDILVMTEGIWVSCLALAIILILFSYAAKIRYNREKYMQTLLIAGGFTVPTVVGIITQVVFPAFLDMPSVPVSSTVMSFFSISSLIALTRFKLFKTTSSVAAGTIIETIKDIVIIANPQERLEFFNSQGTAVLGLNPKKVEQFSVRDLFPNENIYQGFIRCAWSKALNGGYSESFDTVFLKQDGGEIPVSLSVVPIPVTVNYQSFPSILLVARDITEQKAAARQLQEQAELLDKAQDAIIVRDLDYNVIYWNKSAERLYGWNREEIIENPAARLYQETSAELTAAKESVLEKGEWIGELKQMTRGGTEIIVQSRWNLVHDASGRPKSILTVNTDITDKKRIESQFLRAQRLESIGTLTGGIAHDLNNILSPIMMSVEILKMDLSESKRDKILTTLESSVKRGSDIIRQLLIFARGGVEKEQANVRIEMLIENILKIIRGTFPKSIAVTTSVPDNLWTVNGDTTRLEQMLLNLCVNARDAMPKGGKLSINAENIILDENAPRLNIDAKAGPYACIEVKDSGTGIAPEIIDKIFEPFFTTKEVGKGTGLGLSSLSGIVRSHGGFVSVHSEVGTGTSFKVYIPANQSKKDFYQEDKQAELLKGSGELILVVDDEVSVRQILKTTLESSGYKVLTANDGIQAIEIYKEFKDKIKIVLTDISMPEMDGLTTTKALLLIEPDVKVILTSGLTSYQHAADVLGNKDINFLQKPYTSAEVLKKIKGIL